jgi:quercetin dioxygenase-like cupin family protein
MPGFVLGPREGPAYGFHGARIVIKASGEHTHGQLGVMESTYPPGLSVHTHVHAGEHEMFYVLAGELTGCCGEDSWTAGPGSFVFVPRDHPHSFMVTSPGPVTALVISTPSQLDRQVAERGESSLP